MSGSNDVEKLIARAAGGDELAASELFSKYRDRLRKMVQLRLDRRLYGRVDASDVVQVATFEAARRLSEYVESRPVSFFLWLRQVRWGSGTVTRLCSGTVTLWF